MIGLILFSTMMLLTYLVLKYSAYRTFFNKRPTFKEVWAYSFENDVKRGRNAKAFKYFAIFLAFFAMLAVIASPGRSLVSELKDKSYVLVILKIILVFMCGMNFMARYVLYEEEHKGDKTFVMPLLEIFDVFRKTKWIVRGDDVVSITVNFSTLAIVMVLISIVLLNTYY